MVVKFDWVDGTLHEQRDAAREIAETLKQFLREEFTTDSFTYDGPHVARVRVTRPTKKLRGAQ